MKKSVIKYLKIILEERTEYDKILEHKGPLMYNEDLMKSLRIVIEYLQRKN